MNQETRLKRIADALSSVHWRWKFNAGDACPATVGGVLAEKLPHIDPKSWPARFELGGVYLNGRPVLSDRQIAPPCSIEYYEPKYDISKAADFFPAFKPEYVVYRDDDLMVVFKPAGLPSFQCREQRFYNLRASVEKYVGHKVHMPSRLDTSVSGLVLVSLSSAMHKLIQRIYEKRAIKKIYILETGTIPAWDRKEVVTGIDKDPIHPILRQVTASGGKSATTFFTRLSLKTIGGKKPSAFIKAKPVTGRTHQIRIHAAHTGIPIIGDNFYGGSRASSLHLISTALSLTHPGSGAELKISLPDHLKPKWLKSCST